MTTHRAGLTPVTACCFGSLAACTAQESGDEPEPGPEKESEKITPEQELGSKTPTPEPAPEPEPQPEPEALKAMTESQLIRLDAEREAEAETMLSKLLAEVVREALQVRHGGSAVLQETSSVFRSGGSGVGRSPLLLQPCLFASCFVARATKYPRRRLGCIVCGEGPH